MAKVPLTPKSMVCATVASSASMAVKRPVSMLVTYSVLPSGARASERGFGGTGMRPVMRPCGESTRTWLPAMSVVNILSVGGGNAVQSFTRGGDRNGTRLARLNIDDGQRTRARVGRVERFAVGCEG